MSWKLTFHCEGTSAWVKYNKYGAVLDGNNGANITLNCNENLFYGDGTRLWINGTQHLLNQNHQLIFYITAEFPNE